MTAAKRTQVRNAARALLIRLWKERGRIWSEARGLSNLIPVPTAEIARALLNVILEEPEEIPSENRSYETAGFMDRATNRIVVAQKYRPEWRRFTMAHEIGHWVIHPGVNYHRDRPLTGAEQGDAGRTEEEQEADLFASELVMPTKPLVEWFRQSFGERVDGRSPDPVLAFVLGGGTRQEVNEISLSKDLRYRAMLVAQTSSFGPNRPLVPLAARFGVSPTAMAIRLEGLGLVI